MKQLQLTKSLISALALFAFSTPALVYAKGGCAAEKIDFNCDTHKVTLVGSNIPASPLNCGRSTPTNHSGTIGNPGRAVGSVWPSMKGAPKVDIGLGAVIVHTLPPKKRKNTIWLQHHGRSYGLLECFSASDEACRTVQGHSL